MADKKENTKLKDTVAENALGDGKPELPEDALDILDSKLSIAEKGLVLAAAYNIPLHKAMQLIIKAGK